MYIQLKFQYVYFVSTNAIKQNFQTLYFELAHNKFSFVFYFKLNHHTLLFCILCLKINTITITIINFPCIINLHITKKGSSKTIFFLTSNTPKYCCKVVFLFPCFLVITVLFLTPVFYTVLINPGLNVKLYFFKKLCYDSRTVQCCKY